MFICLCDSLTLTIIMKFPMYEKIPFEKSFESTLINTSGISITKKVNKSAYKSPWQFFDDLTLDALEGL